jgi:hypothetical protein
MNDEEPIEPADPDVAKLFEKERLARAPDDALVRVWSRLGLIPPISNGGTVPRSPAQGWLASHALAVAVASFVGGMATGAGLYASIERPTPVPVASADRATPPPASTPLPPVIPPVEPTTSRKVVREVPPAPRASIPESPPASLRPERDVLDRARSLLAEGDARGALVLLDDHASRFPRPQLGEEREALAIQSLVTLKRYDEARARATRFHNASPSSLFAPVIDAAIESIP